MKRRLLAAMFVPLESLFVLFKVSRHFEVWIAVQAYKNVILLDIARKS